MIVYQNDALVTDLLFDRAIVKGGEVSRAVPINADGRDAIEALVLLFRVEGCVEVYQINALRVDTSHNVKIISNKKRSVFYIHSTSPLKIKSKRKAFHFFFGVSRFSNKYRDSVISLINS